MELNLEEKNAKNEEAEILAMMNQQEEYTPEPEPSPEPTPEQKSEPNKKSNSEDLDELNAAFTEMLDPAIIITMFDGFMVMLSSLIFKAMKLEVDKSVMQLTAQEKAALKPSVKEFLKSLDLKLSPLTALILSVGLIYGSKISVVITESKLTGKRATALKDKPTQATKSTRKGVKRGSYKKKSLNIKLNGE
jgi:hypothetical protein